MSLQQASPPASGGFDFNTITEVRLSGGSHTTAQDGLCFMEMVAWFAGEKHSDKPACASRVLGTYGIVINDNTKLFLYLHEKINDLIRVHTELCKRCGRIQVDVLVIVGCSQRL